MLTEHEQLADHEARMSRQELPPLQQPLDNIEEIKHALDDPWLPFDSAPDGIKLLWYFFASNTYELWFKDQLCAYADVPEDLSAVWQPLPPPPKDKND